MPASFGPQLIGETEKTLNALLRQALEQPALSEPQWVTLRLADLLDGTVDGPGLVAAVVDRAHFDDGAGLVRDLNDRGLLDDGRLTSAGRKVISDVQSATARRTASIWNNLPADDVAAATRVLQEVLLRARAALQ